MNFKELLKNDINNVFFNMKEFSTEHEINGQKKEIIVDNEQLEQIKKNDVQGIFKGDTLFYIKEEDVNFTLSIEKIISFDDEVKRILDISHESGVYMIVLEANIG